MIIFTFPDDKIKSIQKELDLLNIQNDYVKVRHPILTPFFIIKLYLKRKNIKVFVFRYLNDSNSILISLLRVISDMLSVFLLKSIKTQIWWLCHNVDKESFEYFHNLIKIRRKLILKNCEYVFTTSELLIPKATELFKGKSIDNLSLGYIEDGIKSIKTDKYIEEKLLNWITRIKKDNTNSRFIFCIGSLAPKVLHFEKINNLINNLNNNSLLEWYAVVVGYSVNKNKFIFNIPFTITIDPYIIIQYADFYYRVMDDYSISYTVYEAAYLKKPIITENYGILPKIVLNYNIGIVLDNYNDLENKIETYKVNNSSFANFLKKNNWKFTALKIKKYYDMI
jgi:hypothetical protein